MLLNQTAVSVGSYQLGLPCGGQVQLIGVCALATARGPSSALCQGDTEHFVSAWCSD